MSLLDETRIGTQFLWCHTQHKTVHYQISFSFPPPAPFSMLCKSRKRGRSNSYHRIITFDWRVIRICLNSSVRGCSLELRTNRISSFVISAYLTISIYCHLTVFYELFSCLLFACMQSGYHARRTNRTFSQHLFLTVRGRRNF